MPRVSERWEKIGFHQPSNLFSLARMKDLFQKYISNVWKVDEIIAYTNQRIRFD